MNENEYLELIRSLLECEAGNETAVLEAHPELVNEELVETLREVAQNMREENNPELERTIERLDGFTAQLAADLGLEMEISENGSSQEQFDFLINVLSTIEESEGNPQVIYPLFQANLTHLNEKLIPALHTKFAAVRAELEAQPQPVLVSVVMIFADLLQQFPLGSQLVHLEIAIHCYRLALEVRTREAFPADWAKTQMNLAVAYSQRIRGEKWDNLERSIDCYRLALEVRTREAFPADWAKTQMNLAVAYSQRIRGERAANLEDAIGCYRLALEVRTREAFPKDWAMTQNNLGVAYKERIRGEKWDNLERSIDCYRLALEVRTREALPKDWATTQMNLAIAYKERIRGEKWDNLERSIDCYRLVLKVFTREAFPQQWAMTQNNLGVAYSDRIRGERAANLEDSIEYYRLALEVFTQVTLPEQWATTQNNLGVVYSQRSRGETRDNLERSIDCYRLALEVRTREALPKDWATTQNNLGEAYKERIQGKKRDNLEQSIDCYGLALEVFTREAFPEDWAKTQNNLGEAYKERIQGKKRDNLEQSIDCYGLALEEYTRDAFPEQWAMTQNNLGIAYQEIERVADAIKCYQSALEIRNPELLPLECLTTARNLGNLAFYQRDWQLAIDAYDLAIRSVETSRSWATSDNSRQEILRDCLDVYQNAIQAAIDLDRLDLAIQYSERGRSRQLVDFMATKDLYLDGEIPPEVAAYIAKYQELEERIRNSRVSPSDNSPTENRHLAPTRNRAAFQAASEEIAHLEAEKQSVWQKIRAFDPVFAAQQQVTPIDLATIQTLITNSHTAILSFYTTSEDTHIFILTQDRQPQIHTCKGQGLESFQLWLRKTWMNPYIYSGVNIQAQIAKYRAEIDLAAVAEKPDLEAALAKWIDEQLEAEKLLGEQSWQDLMPNTLAEIARRLELDTLIAKLPNIEELIVIPHLFLHQIPLGALPLLGNEGTKRRGDGNHKMELLGDRFMIRYAPSCQILKYCLDRSPSYNTQYAMVENADGTLPGASYEADNVANLFDVSSDYRLQGKERATIENFISLLKQSVTDCLIANHAQSRLDNPLESGLNLADGNYTLDRLLISRFPWLQEIFLSCCETHLGIANITDDLLTLGTGFLCAGARTVISTLWAVDDLATALFSIFYYTNRHRGFGRAKSLQMAQVSLRNLSGEEFKLNYAQDLKKYLTAYAQKIKTERNKLAKTDREEFARLTGILNKTLDIRSSLETLSKRDRPFEAPYYWAAFTCQGLA